MELARQDLEAGDVDERSAGDALQRAGEQQLLVSAGPVAVDEQADEQSSGRHQRKENVQSQHGGKVQSRLQQVQTHAE